MGQKDVGEVLSLKQPAVSLLLGGKRKVRPIHIKKMAAKLGIRPEALISKSEEWVSAASTRVREGACTPGNANTRPSAENVLDPVVEQHEKLIRQFPNPSKGLELNSWAVRLAKMNPNSIDGVIEHIKNQIIVEEAKKITGQIAQEENKTGTGEN